MRGQGNLNESPWTKKLINNPTTPSEFINILISKFDDRIFWRRAQKIILTGAFHTLLPDSWCFHFYQGRIVKRNFEGVNFPSSWSDPMTPESYMLITWVFFIAKIFANKSFENYYFFPSSSGRISKVGRNTGSVRSAEARGAEKIHRRNTQKRW